MTTQFINYSEAYYQALTRVPDKQYGKFVVLEHNGNKVCLFAAIEQAEYHANIVEHYARSKKLQGYYNEKRDVYLLSNQDWLIQGGGHWQYQESKQELVLFGTSIAYGHADFEWVRLELRAGQIFDKATILLR